VKLNTVMQLGLSQCIDLTLYRKIYECCSWDSTGCVGFNEVLRSRSFELGQLDTRSPAETAASETGRR
jgi:hypothetical protein